MFEQIIQGRRKKGRSENTSGTEEGDSGEVERSESSL